MSSVVHDLRRTRRVRRLGELEWFEVAYRVYLAALVGGAAVLWLSGLVTDEPVTPAQLADVVERGPAVLGLALAVAAALGLRSGSDGGPVSIEAPDVTYLLLAPVPRHTVLARPVVQRLRSLTFGGALVGAIAGNLAARRLPGSPEAWTASGAAAGAVVGLAFVATAVLVHVARLPRWAATALAVLVLAAQGGAVAGWWTGPGDFAGSLAMWGMRQQPLDLVGVAIVVLAAGAAVALAGRLRVEPLVRRADLVSQLHFAVTMQDLRTVVLLRRQLRGERPRTSPWLRLGRRPAGRAAATVWRRGWRGLLRYPAARLLRMTMLAAVAGVAAVVVLHDVTPAVVALGFALYLLGLDAVEPLAQEIDHPDRTDDLPTPRGWLLAHHLAAPLAAVVLFGLVGAAVVALAEPEAWAAALALCVPVTWVGVGGAIVSIVRDAPDPLAPPVASSAAVPPEFAGFTSTLRLVWPIAVSTLAALPVVALREQPTAGTAVRSTVGLALVVVVIVWWVRRRDEWRTKWRAFIDAGRRSEARP